MLYEVDYETRYENTDKFRQAAITFQKYGYYTTAPIGTSEYLEYWDREMDRCLNGYTTDDGDYISGYNYFYLNYCVIMLVKEKEIEKNGKKRKVLTRESDFPRFWDSDKQFFDAVEEAEEQGKHLAVLKTRGRGYSYKAAAMLNRNFFLIEGSTSLAVASEKEFLVKDGVLSKAWEMMNFINEHTAWYKKRQAKDTEMHKRASLILNEDGKKIETGYMSEIMGITLKNDSNRMRGKRAKLILYEEAGKFPGLLEAWQIARPSVEQGESTYGLMIAFGTGGSEDGDFGSLKELFYAPKAYNLLPINNVWDTGAEGNSCGFFIPEYMNSEGYMDEYGNSLIEKARVYSVEERKKVEENANDRSAVDRYIAEHPFCLHGDTWVSVEGINENVELQKIKDVKNKFENGIQDIYKLITEDNRELLCTNTHHIYNGTEYKPLSNYKIGDTIKLLPFYFSNKYQYIDIDYKVANLKFNLKIDEDWGKFIGIFMGDGSFYSRRYTNELEFSLDYRDNKTINWISNFCIDHNLGNVRTDRIGGMIRLRVSNAKLLDFFKQLELIHRTSEKGGWRRKVHVPEYIIKSPKKVISSFLSGVFDTDGSITKSQGNISMYTKHEDFSRDIIMLLTGFGIYPKYSKQEKINSSGRNYIGRKISIRKLHNLKFLEYIGFISDRKQNILRDKLPTRNLGKDLSYDTIKSIEYWGKDEVFNMQTDIKYYSANGIHTHNSPMEACLQLAGNIFPKKDLAQQLARLQTNKALYNYKQVGDLIFDDNGILKWVQTKDSRDIIKYPLGKNDDKTGAIVIWEHPPEDIPYGLYIGGSDTYDHDDSGTGSLGSTFIYKRFQNFESYYDMIVAEYTGRPDTADEYYENVRKLLLYYNATLLYENERKGIFPYFTAKSCDYLLADQPDIVNDIIRDSKVKRKKGIHMVQSIKDWGEREIRDWLNEEISPGVKQLTRIMSIPLLQELIAYNSNNNFDRVMALMMVMIYKKELHKVQIKEKTNQSKSDPFLSGPIFPRSRTLNFNIR